MVLSTQELIAAYRMQFFSPLKASGRNELNSTNLWGGSDEPAADA